MVQTDFSI